MDSLQYRKQVTKKAAGRAVFLYVFYVAYLVGAKRMLKDVVKDKSLGSLGCHGSMQIVLCIVVPIMEIDPIWIYKE